MSYNYLPLDRKWLSFQQVKNLLDYNQLVSVTFDAHERILKCREYLDNVPPDEDGMHGQLQYDLLKNSAYALGDEVPADIVKLMLMLQIKSLSYGHSGVQIETVKRLMEMYNNEVLPVIYTQGGDRVALSHLSLPLIGLGEVNYKGKKTPSAQAFSELNWKPVNLQSYEGQALITGTQFTSAYALYALKRAEQLIQVADVTAALSFDTCGCSTEAIDKKTNLVIRHKGQAETAAVLSKYLQCSKTENVRNRGSKAAPSFSCTPQVHGAAKDAFEYVLTTFLKEINSVTGSPVIFADEKLILNPGNGNSHLSLAADFLTIAMGNIAAISQTRTGELVSLPAKSPEADAKSKALASIASHLVSENKQLSIPAFTDSAGANAAVKCAKLINNAEKILAIEWMVAVQVTEHKGSEITAPFLKQLVKDFKNQAFISDKNQLPEEEVSKAVDFIRSLSSLIN